MAVANDSAQKITLLGFVMMFFTSVLGFANVSRGVFYMGTSSILFYVIIGFLFFLPYAVICAEMGASFKNEKGGIYSWIAIGIGGSFGRKLGFITIFMWWFSYVAWMLNISATITIPLSYITSPFLPGGFANATKFIQNFLGPVGMGLIGMVIITTITLLISLGVKNIAKLASIGGTAVMSLNVILMVCGLVIWASNDFKSASEYTFTTMTQVPNYSKYAGSGVMGIIGLLGFAVYAIFAYGGVEAIGGLVDKLENPEKNVKRGLLIGASVGIFVYCVGILVTSLVINRHSPDVIHDIMTPAQGGTGLYYTGNAVYYVMFKLGSGVGTALHFTTANVSLLGNIFAAYTGLSMFLALTGAFFVLIYSPLKQLIEGTPAGVFPAKMSKLNKNGIPTVALVYQLILVIALILLNTLGGEAVKDLIQGLITLTNVTMTVPVIFVIYAYIPYLKNNQIEKPIKIFKSYKVAVLAAWVAIVIIAFANIFTIADPIILALQGHDVSSNIKEASMSGGGIIVFAIIGWILISRYERRTAQGKINLKDYEQN